ncbi:MAG: o-succinylbenzoate synthase [Bacteroidetes bacterium]|nr:o-succinylbenzoate synthase [Bacteroidota bacterium]
MKISFENKIYQFKQPSGTSRGILTEKQAWFIKIEHQNKVGVGECSIIPGLSPDFVDSAEYESRLDFAINCLEENVELVMDEPDKLLALQKVEKLWSFLLLNTSIHFGLEMALLDWEGNGQKRFFNNGFTDGTLKIPINGLIWMGAKEFVLKQIEDKKSDGYGCMKMKVGALPKTEEIDVLTQLRKIYPINTVLRIDANGAFDSEHALVYLNEIEHLNIHSVEQPIPAGNWKSMAILAKKSPIPIALDEELIGIVGLEKERLLKEIKPQYIILKPSLHGGIHGCREWISLAEKHNVGWWITSALESNHGLDCIAQLVAEYPVTTVHGLGTGSLYIENEPTALKVENGFIQRKLNISNETNRC